MILSVLAKLVLVIDGTPLVVDYSTPQRCEAARKVVEQEVAQRLRDAQSKQPPGTVLVKPPLVAIAFCLPD